MKQARVPTAIVVGMGSESRALGRESGLLRCVPDDMRRFSTLTRGKPVVIGRKTFELIIQSKGSPLAARPNIVVSRNPTYQFPGVIVRRSLEAALEAAFEFDAEEVHIGGGSELYDQVFLMVDRLYLTLFHDDKVGEAFFPDFSRSFREVGRSAIRAHQGLAYEWVDYVREPNQAFVPSNIGRFDTDKSWAADLA